MWIVKQPAQRGGASAVACSFVCLGPWRQNRQKDAPPSPPGPAGAGATPVKQTMVGTAEAANRLLGADVIKQDQEDVVQKRYVSKWILNPSHRLFGYWDFW